MGGICPGPMAMGDMCPKLMNKESELANPDNKKDPIKKQRRASQKMFRQSLYKGVLPAAHISTLIRTAETFEPRVTQLLQDLAHE